VIVATAETALVDTEAATVVPAAGVYTRLLEVTLAEPAIVHVPIAGRFTMFAPVTAVDVTLASPLACRRP